jgi:lipoprotein-anchoring transpeptidase ErfK/SrfK
VRTRPFIVAAAILAALVVFGGVTYAYDNSRRDTIAKGVRVAGVDIGGMKADAARTKLATSIQERLQEPVVVRHGDDRWKLRARRAHVRANVDAMVDQALDRSRDGNALTRSVRSIAGRSLDEDLKPTVTFNERAVNRLVRHVRNDVDRPARDAKVTMDGSGLTSVDSRTGVAVRTKRLRARVRTELVSLSSDRTVAVRTRSIKPKVTSKEADREYKTAIVVNRSAFQLTLYKDLKAYKTYPIAVGQVGLETPAGLYHIQNKAVNPAWSVPNSAWAGSLAGSVVPGGSPENPLKARWLGIYNGAGIHGTSEDGSIGSAASHGCIRMHIPDVIELYDRVPVGAPVYIA